MAAHPRPEEEKKYIVRLSYPNGCHHKPRHMLAIRLRSMIPDDTDGLSPEEADEFVGLSRAIAQELIR